MQETEQTTLSHDPFEALAQITDALSIVEELAPLFRHWKCFLSMFTGTPKVIVENLVMITLDGVKDSHLEEGVIQNV